MRDCLIGHTGFVGSNLLRQRSFSATFNSKNISEIKGQEFDTIYCAGVKAAKWQANREPTDDLKSICILLDNLREVKAKKFILVSTIDVFKNPIRVTEKTPISTEGLHPYGLHRRLVEQFVTERFNDSLIVRLPGLYGDGLKKNILYDFLNGNSVQAIHSESVFQFYNLDRLNSDIEKALQEGLSVIHLATEPVSVREVALAAFDQDFQNEPNANPAQYDFRSDYSSFYGSESPYLLSKKEVLEDVRSYVLREKARRPCV